MGTIRAPNCTNVFMGKFERSPASSSQTRKYTKEKKKQKEEQITNVNVPETNRSQNFLDPTAAYMKSLINSIPFSQALQLKKICSETLKLNKHLNELKQPFVNCS